MPTAYRTGTYIAFHANGMKEPTESDIKYYNLLKAWHVREDNDFSFTDSHEKTGSMPNATDVLSKVRTGETTSGHRAAQWLRTLMKDARGGPIR